MSPTSARVRATLCITASLAVVVVGAPASTAETPHATERSAPADGPARGDSLPFSWQILSTGSIGNLMGLDVVNEDVVWASSIDTAEVLLTTNGGESFDEVAPPEGVEEGLQFFDIEATSANDATVLSGGAGPANRLYHTSNGGDSWDEVFRSEDDTSFFNCISFFDEQRGVAQGDPVNGKFQILITNDGGASWELSPASGMPDALPGEIGWAAGGGCINATGKRAWFGTGGHDGQARVFRSDDYGMTWTVSDSGLAAGASGGIMGIDFRTNKLGIAIGGDFTLGNGALARSTDGGTTWQPIDGAIPGYRTGVAFWSDIKGSERSERLMITDEQKHAFAVGLTGSEVSTNRGKTWATFDGTPLNSIDCLENSPICWAAGGGGILATLAVG